MPNVIAVAIIYRTRLITALVILKMRPKRCYNDSGRAGVPCSLCAAARTRVGAQMLLERVRVLESGTCCLELARSASNCRTA